MYGLVNAMFGFQLRERNWRGKWKKKPKSYKTAEELYQAYSKLDVLQRMFIIPAWIYPDGKYDKIEFEFTGG